MARLSIQIFVLLFCHIDKHKISFYKIFLKLVKYEIKK